MRKLFVTGCAGHTRYNFSQLYLSHNEYSHIVGDLRDAAITCLLQDRSIRFEMGDVGRVRSETLFTIPILASDYESACSESLAL
jgi:hypothetical protein